ncbi:MAG: hypothetical protein IH986_04295, partial [Planctomycetes bacterium]|nr:hypothetical protein [Planctomycetota bacterium]
MTLAGEAAVALGGAIAKGILKLWLKDHAVGAMVGADLVDILKSKTKDRLAREKGVVHFRAIGLKVAESLLPVFEDEGAGIDEGGLTAVALAVVGTLEKTPITSEILAARNLDPQRLADHLRKDRGKFTVGFGEVESALYDRIISESSQQIVDVASDLPAFQERNFAEVLNRLDLFLPKLDELLQITRKMYETSQKANPETNAARFERDYRAGILAIFLAHGTQGDFYEPPTFVDVYDENNPSGSKPCFVKIGDLDQDGHNDVVVTN